MKLAEFLDRVVPDGTVILAQKMGYFKHVPYSSRAKLLDAIRFQSKTSKDDLYFALASYKQGFYKNAKGKKVVRTRDNVDKLKALWFDIDFKDGYAGKKEVVLALRDFCTKSGTPTPSILVSSGNGIHAYWPLTHSVSYARWQVLANSLKNQAKLHGLKADLVCTADACRILRPPGTRNWKDPKNPKPVVFLYASEVTHDPDVFDKPLGQPERSIQHDAGSSDEPAENNDDNLGDIPAHLARAIRESESNNEDGFSDYTVTHGGTKKGSKTEALFGVLAESCAVARHHRDSRGADASEPEWTAVLQLLKFCSDGELWLHEVSDGHPDYSAEATVEKFNARLDNEAGPTTCEYFGNFRPELCRGCPSAGRIRTPLLLGEQCISVDDFSDVISQDGGTETKKTGSVQLHGWRIMPNNEGMERKVLDQKSGEFEWQKVLERVWSITRVTRTTTDKSYSLRLRAKYATADDIIIEVPSQMLGCAPELRKLLADKGVPLLTHEINSFGTLMHTWLGELQKNRVIEDTTDQLGWIRPEDDDSGVLGFAAGDTAYYTDGTVRTSLQVKKEYEPVGKAYTAHGSYEKWQEVANFLAEQNNPALTAVLASAFAAPLMTFAGVPGGLLSVVSKESARGKTSVMKAAQAVWGSPTLGMNSIDDTRMSVASKLAFLNNLPAYWDELRGKKTMDDFLQLAFQVSQGKEKTRLDSNANMKNVHTWETLLVAASNESIFDHMGLHSAGSDAGVARTYEIDVPLYASTLGPAAIQALFAQLNGNYGHAGKVYSEFLAHNYASVREDVLRMLDRVSKKVNSRPQERFWISTMSCLLVGAMIASKLGIVNIDVGALLNFLIENLHSLRVRSESAMSGTTPTELITSYMQQHGDKILRVDQLHLGAGRPPTGFSSTIMSPPKGNRIICVASVNDSKMLCNKSDFVTWLRTSKKLSFSTVRDALALELGMEEKKTSLGLGTQWELPRASVLCFNIDYGRGELK